MRLGHLKMDESLIAGLSLGLSFGLGLGLGLDIRMLCWNGYWQCYKYALYSHEQNVLRILVTLPNLLLSTSETKRDY